MENFNNKPYNSELHQGSANPRACYSSLSSYGVNGNFVKTIINPTPAAVTPQLYWRLLQHNVPANLVRTPNLIPPTPDFNASHYGKLK